MNVVTYEAILKVAFARSWLIERTCNVQNILINLTLFRKSCEGLACVHLNRKEWQDLGKPSFKKKIYFAKKFHKRGEGVIWISYLYFFIVNAPKYSPQKK